MRRAGLGVAVALAAATAACAGDSPPPEVSAVRAVVAAEPGVLRLAGSGAFVPLARRLGDAYGKSPRPLRIVVEDSLGSAGGAAAAADGAVDVALLSRPLSESERARGLETVPVAVDAVVIAANSAVPVDGLTSDALRELYAGHRRTFEGGAPAAVLLRDRGESANAVLVAAVPGLNVSRGPGEDDRQMRVLYHDASMLEALAATPGGLGVSSLGLVAAAAPAVKVLALDGRTPSLDALEQGTWPVKRPLAFAASAERLERARDFLSFVFSEEGAQVIRAAQALPVARP